jgi:hypothetical protein
MYGGDQMRATPQSRITGPVANAVRKAQQFASQYEIDPRIPLLGGTGVDELLSLPDAASLLEDVSYNGMGALVRGGNAATGGIGTFRLDPRIVSAADVAATATGVGKLGALAARAAPGAVKAGARNLSTPRTLNPQAGVFMGPKAKTWNQGKADMAIAMEEAGRTPAEIWQATGTFRAADGILRQEIDDRAAKFLSPSERQERIDATKSKIAEMKERIKPTTQKDLFPKALTEAKKEVRDDISILKSDINLREKNPRTQGLMAQHIFEHPELYAAYPELQSSVKIITEGGRGGNARGALSIAPSRGYFPGSMEMDIYDAGLRDNPTSTALHEMQHAVQTIEGMGPGGNPTFAFSNPEAHDILKRLREDVYKPSSFEDFQRVNKFPEDEAQAAYEQYVKERKANPITSDKVERAMQETAAMEYYKRLLGEAEARAVQDRQMMTPQQRMETPPPASYDVPQEDLIVKPPREYAHGGPVHISNDPDVMQLELAGGGLVKKLAKLARAPAKSKAEIDAIAERLAPQVTGEYVRKDAKTAKTVAGKTQKQFQREKTLPIDVRPTGEERVPELVDIEKLKGDVMIGIPGDPTLTGKTLYGVGDFTLGSPSPQHGGPLYGLYNDDAFWASGIGPARGVQNLAKRASKQYDAPVKGNYIMMGPDSINYAQHFADANLQAIDLSRMTKAQVDQFNELIRKGSKKSGPRESFPGIEDKDSAYLQMAMDPELRKHFNALMQMPTVTETLNLPSGTDIRFAITEPSLRDLETGVTGYSMGKMRPDIASKELPLSTHPTYDYDIPGEFMGQSKYPMPYELSFPDTLQSIRANPKQARQEFGSLKMVGPRQTIDQQMIDEIKMYEERMKRLTGKKAGGAVRKFEGGEITADDLILEERKL